MDNVCHTLVGAALGGAGLDRRTRFATPALMIASNIPDLDVLVFATGVPSVAFRRGWTHGTLAQLLLPVALTGAFWLYARRRRAPVREEPPLRLGWLLALAYLGTWLHVGMDYLNTYGIRLLAPLDWRWFYGDAVFIVDPWLWLSLGMGVWLARRWRWALPSRAALVAAACYVMVMVASARAARSAVVEIWREEHGAAPVALMVGPVPVTPFAREVIVDAGDHYETGRFTWPAFVEWSPEPIPKNEERAEVAAVRASLPLDMAGLLVWSRFPYWRVEPATGGAQVTLGDARFRTRGIGFQASTVVEE